MKTRVALLGLVCALGLGSALVACSDDDTPATPGGSTPDAGPVDPNNPTPGVDAGPGGSDAATGGDGSTPTPTTGVQDRVYVSSALGLEHLAVAGGDPVKVNDKQNGNRVILSPDRKRVAASLGFAATATEVYDRDNKKIGAIAGIAIAWLDNDTLLFGEAGGAGNSGFNNLKRVKFDGSGEQLIYTPAAGGAPFRAYTTSVSKDGKMIAIAQSDNTLKVITLATGAVTGTVSAQFVNGPYFTRDGNVVWAAGFGPQGYNIAPPTLASPKAVDVGAPLGAVNLGNAFNDWAGNDFVVGVETTGAGGLRISKLMLGKTDGSKPVEITGITAIGNVLVERVHLSIDGKTFIYHSGKTISRANVDGSGKTDIKTVLSDPQTIAW